MAKGFKHGSGGLPLNFKVVGGTTAPGNPKENTIWVNTDQKVTGYIFSATDPNLLDFDTWANNTVVLNGTKTVSGKTISITANENGDAYTAYQADGASVIPCTPGKTYVLQWSHSGDEGSVFIFPSANGENLLAIHSSAGQLEFTPPDGVTFFTFRFGARYSNTTAVYSNIRITLKEQVFSPGSVWFSTSTVSNVEFNALKKNGIQVYPISAKQYVSGAWVDVTAQSYQGGAWVDWFVWDGTLFPESPGIVQITGGWVNDPNISITDRANTASSSMTEDTITILAPGGSKSTNLATANYIDMTGYSYLTFNVTAMSSSFDAVGMIYVDGQTSHADAASSTVFTAAGEKSIAVPSGGGEYRVAFGLSTSSAQRSFTVSEVRLVK